MASKQQRPRANRYKKQSGKGGFVLAAFVVLVCILIVGAFLLHRFRQPQQLTPPSSQVVPAAPLAPPTPQPAQTSANPSKLSPHPQDKVVEQVPPVKQDYYSGDIVFPKPKHPVVAGKAELAVLIDDMGSSLQEARDLAGIGVPISFAIIPGLRQFRDVAEYAAGQGIQVLVHMPMQPREYPQRRLESNGLLLEQSDEELRAKVQGFLDELPHAVGANNHMGSGFTEHADKMRVVLTVLKEKGLFYLDSITTPRTVGLQVAAELHMRRGRRDVFLDNEQNEGYIMGQLEQAVTRARKNGRAVAICHPHPVTIATLRKVLPGLQAKGVTLVPVSRLMF